MCLHCNSTVLYPILIELVSNPNSKEENFCMRYFFLQLDHLIWAKKDQRNCMSCLSNGGKFIYIWCNCMVACSFWLVNPRMTTHPGQTIRDVTKWSDFKNIIMPLQIVLIPLFYAYIAGKLVCCFYYYKCDEFLPHENVVAHEHHSHGLIIKISATKFPQNCT